MSIEPAAAHYARFLVRWRISNSMQTDCVLDALEQALYARKPPRDGALVHHSERGSPYVSTRYTERLAEAGIEPEARTLNPLRDAKEG